MSAQPSARELNARDNKFLRRAFSLAAQGYNAPSPNPRVGCVVVKADEIIGSAYHHRYGAEHAEVLALSSLNVEQSNQASVYVSLEPCRHHGKTPPCTDTLIAAKVSRVVCGVVDDNPVVQGKGIARLRQAGIEVHCADWALDHLLLNPGYVCALKQNRPWFRLKLATSLDGYIAMPGGQSQWISGTRSRAYNQRWRGRSDAVLSSWRSVTSDQARLNIRQPSLQNFQPTRVILDKSMRASPKLPIFSTDLHKLVWVTGLNRPAIEALGQSWRLLRRRGLTIWSIPSQTDEDFFIGLGRLLLENQLREIQLEVGGDLSNFVLSHNFVDELTFYIAPKLIGAGGMSYYQNTQSSLSELGSWQLVDSKRCGDDIFVRYLHPRWRSIH